MPRGALIVVEGCDRSGKSTQCARAVRWLNDNGYKAEQWNFPDRRSSIGTLLDNYITMACELDHRVAHLLFSANRWEKRHLMEEKLLGGTTLVVDRYAFSGVAFSVAKGLDREWCKGCDRGLPRPDGVFYLDVDPAETSVREGFGSERYEVVEFQKRVREIFLSLQDESSIIVDASKSIEDVHEHLTNIMINMIEGCKSKPILELWAPQQ